MGRCYFHLWPEVTSFPAIDHALLLDILGRTIGDERTLDLAARIIAGGAGVQADEYDMVYFPGDDPSTGSGQGLFAANRPRGLPIGNLTSQFWANVYLNELDHYIKRQLRCRGYVRYVDDLLRFDDDRATLHAWRGEVIARLVELRLTIHENSAQPRPTRCGVPFLGFQVYPDHRRLKRRNAVQARRRLRALRDAYQRGEVSRERVHVGVQGWVNHARYGDTWGLRRAVLADIVLHGSEDGERNRERRVADFQQDL